MNTSKAKSLVLLLTIAFSAVAIQPACTAKQVKDLEAIGKIVWDCTAPERAQAVAILTPLIGALLTAAATADGKSIDTSALQAATGKSALKDDLSVALECAKAKAFDDAINQPPPPPGSPAAAGLIIDPTALRAAYERIRPANAAFVLPGGKVL